MIEQEGYGKEPYDQEHHERELRQQEQYIGDKKPNGKKIALTAVATVAGMALCICLAATAFVVGRGTAEAETITEVVTETITEMVEVTREVNVEVPVTTEPVDGSEGDDGQTAEATNNGASNPPASTGEPIDDIEDLDLDLLYEAWDLIEEDFDGDNPDKEALIQALIAGSIEALDDDYTRYIAPDVAARMREDMGGSVSGIGAFVRETDSGLFEITTPMEGQPAEIAGLLPGDLVLEVDGEDVTDLTFDEVILMVRGPEGTDVTLGIGREGEGEILEFTITRTRFEVPVVEHEMLDDGIAYVKLIEFNSVASEKMTEALDELLAQNPYGLILDLRNNPGGYLNQSIDIADMFLPKGEVLHERNRQGLDETFRSGNGDMAEEIPLVVLINGGSASASEIVAGAIQDRGRGVLIGETSFGKGSVQTVNYLSDGAELRVTIARWYTPDNNSINGEGITPDIEVERTLEDYENELDPQLERAIEELLKGL